MSMNIKEFYFKKRQIDPRLGIGIAWSKFKDDHSLSRHVGGLLPHVFLEAKRDGTFGTQYSFATFIFYTYFYLFLILKFEIFYLNNTKPDGAAY